MKWVVGIDEVGRGCLAGPVMVGVFAIPEKYAHLLEHTWVKDSKSVTARQRNDAYERLDELARGGHARFVVATQSANVIDSIGIVGAIRLCIAEALSAVDIPPSRAHVYLDGGLRAPDSWLHQSTHVKGDRDYPVISAASIVAKVIRDEYMVALAAEYPEYSWDRNKGYGTLIHRNAVQRCGATEQHRQLFCRKINRLFT